MNVVMLVAEDPALVASVRAVLPETDAVLHFPCIDEALRRLIALRPDVAVIDDAPGLGKPALERMVHMEPAVPVVMLSGHGDSETLAGYTLAGARKTLPKPFSCTAFLAAIDQSVADAAVAPAPSTPRHLPNEATGPQLPGSHIAAIGQHQTALRWLGRAGAMAQDAARLPQTIADALTDVFDTICSVVVLESGNDGVIAASQGLPPPLADGLKLTFASGLMRWFEANGCVYDRDLSPGDADASKEARVLGVRLGAPLRCGGRTTGALLIGEKASGQDYAPEEPALLATFARCASAFLENSQRYQRTSQEGARLDAVLANLATGVVVVDADKSVSLINESAERILQLHASDVIGGSVQKLGSAFADVVLRTLQDGKPRMRQEIRDGAIDASLGLSTTPLGNEGVVVVFNRLPEEKASAREIAYSPFWEYLASRVAQEVKNPMVAINTFAQLLPRKYEAPDFRESFAETVQREIARINTVVETLFDFARRPRLALKRADVNETIRNVLRSFEEELNARSITVETDWDAATPNADLDAVEFSQAVHNVVQNSIEAMPSGGTLRVATRGNDDGCEVVIADSGRGIPEKDAPLVFMPFFSTKEQGMGLGLTVANRIMQQHKGDLRLLSGAGEGGAFALQLPRAEKDDEDRSRH